MLEPIAVDYYYQAYVLTEKEWKEFIEVHELKHWINGRKIYIDDYDKLIKDGIAVIKSESNVLISLKVEDFLDILYIDKYQYRNKYRNFVDTYQDIFRKVFKENLKKEDKK
jgi:hypothetical protein